MYQTSTTKNRSAGSASATTALPANTDRHYLFIQNLDTGVLKVKFGAGASTSDYDVILKGGSGVADGAGGSFNSDLAIYMGIVTVFSAGTPNYVAYDL